MVTTASLCESLVDAAYLKLLARHYEAVAGLFAAYSPDDVFDEKGASWEEAKRQNVSLTLQKTTACLRSIRICPELMSVGSLEALIKFVFVQEKDVYDFDAFSPVSLNWCLSPQERCFLPAVQGGRGRPCLFA